MKRHQVGKGKRHALPEVVAKRKSADDKDVFFWSDGAVTDRMHRYVKGRLPISSDPLVPARRIFDFANNASLYNFDELPGAIEEFKRGKKMVARKVRSVPENDRVYREIKLANGLSVNLRVK